MLQFREAERASELLCIVLPAEPNRSLGRRRLDLPTAWPKIEAQVKILPLLIFAQSEVSIEAQAFGHIRQHDITIQFETVVHDFADHTFGRRFARAVTTEFGQVFANAGDPMAKTDFFSFTPDRQRRGVR